VNPEFPAASGGQQGCDPIGLIVPSFKHQPAIGNDLVGLRDQAAEDVKTVLPAIKRHCRIVFANFRFHLGDLPARYVGWVGNQDVERAAHGFEYIAAEPMCARRKPEANQDVYDLTVRAFPPTFAETAQDNQEALRLLTEALEANPAFPMANALAAWCYQQRHLMDWPGTQPDDRETAARMARSAITGGADAPLALALGGAVRASVTRDHDFALAAVDRAMMINTNAAAVLGFDALTRCVCGSYDTAIEHAGKALRLSPLEPLVYYAAFALALACFLSDRTEEAVAHARKAIEGNRNFAFPYCVLALGCARLGHADEAAQAVRRLVRAAPRFRLASLRKIRFADAARVQSDLELLREAHLPE